MLGEPIMGRQGETKYIDKIMAGNDELASGSQSMSSLHLLFFTERS